MKGFRTLIVNMGIVVLPIIAETLAFLNVYDWKAVLDPVHAGWAILLVGLLNIWLRLITTTPVGKRR